MEETSASRNRRQAVCARLATILMPEETTLASKRKIVLAPISAIIISLVTQSKLIAMNGKLYFLFTNIKSLIAYLFLLFKRLSRR